MHCERLLDEAQDAIGVIELLRDVLPYQDRKGELGLDPCEGRRF